MGRGEAGAVARLHVPLADRGVATQPRKRRSASKRITLRQASNMMAGVAFARQIGTPLNAHATIHWAGTKVGDDPDGRLFARSVKASTSGLSDRASLADCPRYGCASDFQVVRQRWFTARAPLSRPQEAASSGEGTRAIN